MALPTTRFPLISPIEPLQYNQYSIPAGVSHQISLRLLAAAQQSYTPLSYFEGVGLLNSHDG